MFRGGSSAGISEGPEGSGPEGYGEEVVEGDVGGCEGE